MELKTDTTTQLTENKIIFNGPVDHFNERDFPKFDEFFSSDCINHTLPPDMQGLDGILKFINTMLTAFPDMHVEVQKETEMADGDLVMHRLSVTGTHKGIYLGIAATGKKINWTMVRTAKIKNKKIAEFWVDTDRLGIMQQLGVNPALTK